MKTAQQVIQESNEANKKLGEAYSRLQRELLKPIIDTSVEIMEQKGLIPKVRDDR